MDLQRLKDRKQYILKIIAWLIEDIECFWPTSDDIKKVKEYKKEIKEIDKEILDYYEATSITPNDYLDEETLKEIKDKNHELLNTSTS